MEFNFFSEKVAVRLRLRSRGNPEYLLIPKFIEPQRLAKKKQASDSEADSDDSNKKKKRGIFNQINPSSPKEKSE